MKREDFTVATPQLKFLSIEQAGEIHLYTLELLRKTGVRIFDGEAIRLLSDAGAHVENKNLVKFPSYLVEEAIHSAPSRVVLCSRDGEPGLFLQPDRVYFGPGSDCPNIIDPESGKRRKFLKNDVAKGMKICDFLSNIDFVMSMGLISDVPSISSDRHQFESMVTNTKKPIVFTAHDISGCQDIVEMAAVVAGDTNSLKINPFICLYAESTSPLEWTEEATKKLLFMAEKTLPSVCVAGGLVGATTPVTLAGTVVLTNAEALAGLVMAQLKQKGAPVILGGGCAAIDMRTSICAYGSPEFHLTSTALADMAHYYNLPAWGYAGGSDAKSFDQQAAAESAMWILAAFFSKTNLAHDIGYLESGLTSSFEMLVFADEIISQIRRFAQGIRIDDDHMALDVIDKVGPGGHFLAEEHTLCHFREEIFFPSLFDRKNYSGWIQEGKHTLMEKANAEVKKILKTHQVEELSIEVRREIKRIIKSAEK